MRFKSLPHQPRVPIFRLMKLRNGKQRYFRKVLKYLFPMRLFGLKKMCVPMRFKF